jgi:hypothetical protein
VLTIGQVGPRLIHEHRLIHSSLTQRLEKATGKKI